MEVPLRRGKVEEEESVVFFLWVEIGLLKN